MAFPNPVGFRVYNVLQYGTVGSDQTAHNVFDTQPIQDAIQAANDAAGGVVYFPAGTYAVTDTPGKAYCLLVPGNHIVLVGDGPGNTIIKSYSQTHDTIQFGSIDTMPRVQVNHCGIRDLSFQRGAAYKDGSTPSEINALFFENFHITRCNFGSDILIYNCIQLGNTDPNIDLHMPSGSAYVSEIKSLLAQRDWF
jgi:hypothetical protein